MGMVSVGRSCDRSKVKRRLVDYERLHTAYIEKTLSETGRSSV
jgi:hypothetical protein